MLSPNIRLRWQSFGPAQKCGFVEEIKNNVCLLLKTLQFESGYGFSCSIKTQKPKTRRQDNKDTKRDKRNWLRSKEENVQGEKCKE